MNPLSAKPDSLFGHPAYRRGYAQLARCRPGTRQNNYLRTGPFSLMLQDFEEARPADAGNRSSRPAVPDHVFDVQAFHTSKNHMDF